MPWPRSTDPADPERMRAGVLATAAAYTLWGLLPVYLRLVASVSPLELVAHRVIWALATVLVVAGIGPRRLALPTRSRWRAVVAGSAASAAMLALNWFLFLWAVSAGRDVDASLGYFINPLLSVALGALVLREPLSRLRRVAVAGAFLGVVWLTVRAGQVPWIGLALAATFATYGLLRKVAPLGALEGLVLETLLLSPLALGYLAWLGAHGQCRFLTGGPRLVGLVLLAGPITVVPLLLFAAGARRIPLSLVGLLQYIGPTLQLLGGVFVQHEPFTASQLAGYALIWLAFALASADALIGARRTARAGGFG